MRHLNACPPNLSARSADEGSRDVYLSIPLLTLLIQREVAAKTVASSWKHRTADRTVKVAPHFRGRPEKTKSNTSTGTTCCTTSNTDHHCVHSVSHHNPRGHRMFYMQPTHIQSTNIPTVPIA